MTLRLIVLMATISTVVSCTSVGVVTYRLSKYGPPKLESSITNGNKKIDTYSLGGKPFRKETTINGQLAEQMTYSEDGTLYATRNYKTSTTYVQKIFHKSGAVSSISKFADGEEVHFSVYDEDGNYVYGY